MGTNPKLAIGDIGYYSATQGGYTAVCFGSKIQRLGGLRTYADRSSTALSESPLTPHTRSHWIYHTFLSLSEPPNDRPPKGQQYTPSTSQLVSDLNFDFDALRDKSDRVPFRRRPSVEDEDEEIVELSRSARATLWRLSPERTLSECAT